MSCSIHQSDLGTNCQVETEGSIVMVDNTIYKQTGRITQPDAEETEKHTLKTECKVIASIKLLIVLTCPAQPGHCRDRDQSD